EPRPKRGARARRGAAARPPPASRSQPKSRGDKRPPGKFGDGSLDRPTGLRRRWFQVQQREKSKVKIKKALPCSSDPLFTVHFSLFTQLCPHRRRIQHLSHLPDQMVERER